MVKINYFYIFLGMLIGGIIFNLTKGDLGWESTLRSVIIVFISVLLFAVIDFVRRKGTEKKGLLDVGERMIQQTQRYINNMIHIANLLLFISLIVIHYGFQWEMIPIPYLISFIFITYFFIFVIVPFFAKKD